jgi:predicted secreted protein
MKRIIMLVMVILVISTLSLACTKTQRINLEIACDQFSQDSVFTSKCEAKIGDKINIALCSNRTTAFQWRYKTTVENVLKETEHSFQEPKDDVLGAAGKEAWTFEAVGMGTTEIQMEYTGPWEDEEKVEWIYTVTVTVEEG